MRTSLNAGQWAKVRNFVNGFTLAEIQRKYSGNLAYELARQADGGQGRGRQQPLAPALVNEALKWCRDHQAAPAQSTAPVQHLQEGGEYYP